MLPMATCRRSTLLLGVCILAAVVSTRWVRVNISPSTPLGLYRLTAVTRPLTHGTLVVLPVPVSVQPWHSRWVPLLKPVAALPGDQVCLQDSTLVIGVQRYGPVYEDVDGQALPHLVGCHTVAAGQVFLASHAPRSLDSRYFGPVLVTTLTAQAVPLFTWR